MITLPKGTQNLCMDDHSEVEWEKAWKEFAEKKSACEHELRMSWSTSESYFYCAKDCGYKSKVVSKN